MRKNTPFLIKSILFFLLLLANIPTNAQLYQAGADEVISFKPGTGQNSGQTEEYFPHNVLGLPDTSARYTIAATDPNEICSLGFGGEITISFHGKFLVDGEGNDFTVFENAFYAPDFKKIFMEPAIISVSRDGITFVSFPFDSLTFKGCAGITPTNGDKNPFDTAVSGGNSFDLADVGMDSVRYIRIHDISALLLNRKHPLYDPIVSGFDLDAVVGLHLKAIDIKPITVAFSKKSASVYTEEDVEIMCYSIDGRRISYGNHFSQNTIEYPLDFLPDGVFALVVKSENNSSVSTFPFILCR